ncbi:DUF1236 domain-containing protein [Mesorhizobium xinjiangense]|uniref:DUF1236 domain-containing protein n=1 Tax=Mesorhizobium xinjiangense TaxID=2678685 RepID=UPI0012EDB8BC|nr:DUF1236 domain-containing protein [Mesorhizobium xinjiangense]
MTRTIKISATGAAVAVGILGLTGAVAAQSSVIATTDLNMRIGPGPQYGIVTVLPLDQPAYLNGCLETSGWCSISYGGREGWVYSDYLATDYAGRQVIVADHRADLAVPVVVYEGAGGAVVGGSTASDTLIGPADTTVGGYVEQTVRPPAEVRRYIYDRPAEPVYLERQIAVGTGLPPTVEVHEIPDYEYDYVYVNDQPMLIEPQTRRIVYIYR